MRSNEAGVIREIKAPDRSSHEKLLNACFPVPPKKSFFQDFPVWDPNLCPDAYRLGYFQGDEVRGSACVKFSEIQGVSEKSELIALVGAVATHPSIRGQGVASDLIEAVLKKIDQMKTSFTLLWGSEHDLYRRFGFELAGEQVRIPIGTLLSANKPEPLSDNEAIQMGYFGEIFKRRLTVQSGLRLKDTDQKWFGRHENVQWISLMRNGSLVAYLAMNRGIDLEHMVHEWDGSIEDILKLFSEVLKKDAAAEWLTSPAHLAKWGIQISENSKFQKEFLCMARPGVGFDIKKFSNLWIWGLDAC